VPGLGTPLLGGLGSAFAPISARTSSSSSTSSRRSTGSDMVRLTINEQTEEIASRDPVSARTTAKRTAKTTVVARDQQTVVIGGIMQERAIESVKKVPILGDIPILGKPVPHAEPREDQDEPAAVPDPVHHQGLDRTSAASSSAR